MTQHHLATQLTHEPNAATQVATSKTSQRPSQVQTMLHNQLPLVPEAVGWCVTQQQTTMVSTHRQWPCRRSGPPGIKVPGMVS